MEQQIIDSAPLNYQNDDPQPGFLQKLQLHLFTSDLSPKQGVICQNLSRISKYIPKFQEWCDLVICVFFKRDLQNKIPLLNGFQFVY